MSKEKVDNFFKLEHEGAEKLLAENALDLDKTLSEKTVALKDLTKRINELSSEKESLERELYSLAQKLEGVLGVIVKVMDSKENSEEESE